MRRTLLPCLLLTLVAACDSGGPAFPDGDTLIFTGTLADGESIVHDFVMTESRTVRVSATALSAVTETGDPLDDPSVGVSVGRPTTDVDCSATFTTILDQGEDFPIFLEDGERCLIVQRSGRLVVGSTVDYEVTLEDAG